MWRAAERKHRAALELASSADSPHDVDVGLYRKGARGPAALQQRVSRLRRGFGAREVRQSEVRHEFAAPLLVVAVGYARLQRRLEVYEALDLRRRNRVAVERAAVPPAEDAQAVEEHLEGYDGRRRRRKRGCRGAKVRLWHKGVEQVDMRRPAVQARVPERLARFLELEPRVVRRHEGHRSRVHLRARRLDPRSRLRSRGGAEPRRRARQRGGHCRLRGGAEPRGSARERRRLHRRAEAAAALEPSEQ
mmetsp:Transcript_21369/g.72378  ORF Transcript_21369/g.72378 Transcript_21369/m.72378 type:complete len:248 (-) Transcript_21369:90-833(-)